MSAAGRAWPALIDADEVPEYPLGADLRLSTHYFLSWHFDRWLNSRFRVSAPADVRGLALDLYCLAQKQAPVGTLPDDDIQLAALLLLDLRRWQEYRRQEWSPLYGWMPCRCAGTIRLFHPVVLEVIEDSLARRQMHRDTAERVVLRKRLERLPGQMRAAGARKAACEDPAVLEWVNTWLIAHCAGSRTKEWVRRALEAHAANSA